MSNAPELVPLDGYAWIAPEETLVRAREFHTAMLPRRTIRDFSSKPVPLETIEECLRIAGRAPNGANLQPWHFVVVSDQQTKQRIRIAAEDEERAFYAERAPQEWLEALAPLGTDWRKPFLETAPYLIAIFGQKYGVTDSGTKVKNYYVSESVGIAVGFLIAALHMAGLASLTHTPSPMNFLNEILDRPPNEKPFLLLVVGYPSEDARVPRISKKSLKEIATFI